MSAGSDWYRDEDVLIGELQRAVGLPRVEGYEQPRLIDRGAQGLVYEAVQVGTRRKVAIKVLTRGSARGLREIELAARLSHPNIVRIYHSGTTPDRRLFLAMEFVEGVPLDAYVRSGAVNDVDDVLRLFAKVCAAVNYAHQRGVIHRDLKPQNILVDAGGEPHVLDFGVAVATGQDLARTGTVVTRDGQFVGTLAYASPEQVSREPGDLDVRTDVYSLGVILYELLTGRLPVQALGPLTDVVRAITETAPTAPSHVDEKLRAATRRDWKTREEFDAVVLKALAKDPDRRYQSAGELAEDVRRYLAGEAIEAKRDSTLYALKKTLSRHRLGVAVIAAFGLLISATAIALSILYFRADNEAAIARAEAERARTAEAEAAAAGVEAIAARDQARASEATARGSLYLTNLNLAQQAWDRGDLHSMIESLMNARPGPGEEDLRDFGWYHLWRLSEGHAVRTLRGHTREVRAVACSPDGKTLATGSTDHTVKLWDLATGKEVAAFVGIHPIFALAFSPDGRKLAAAGSNLVLWDVATRRELASVNRRLHMQVNAVAFSPDGKSLATAHGWDRLPGEARLWDVKPLRQRAVLTGYGEEVWSVAFSPDGQTLVSTSWSARTRTGALKFWDVKTGNARRLRTLAEVASELAHRRPVSG